MTCQCFIFPLKFNLKIFFKSYFRAENNNDFYQIFDQLKNQSLASIDFQIKALNSELNLSKFLEMLIAILETRRDFDLIQSYLATFLNIHHENIWKERRDIRRKEENNNKSVDENLEKDEQNILLKV